MTVLLRRIVPFVPLSPRTTACLYSSQSTWSLSYSVPTINQDESASSDSPPSRNELWNRFQKTTATERPVLTHGSRKKKDPVGPLRTRNRGKRRSEDDALIERPEVERPPSTPPTVAELENETSTKLYAVVERVKHLLKLNRFNDAAVIVRSFNHEKSILAWNLLIEAAADAGKLNRAQNYWREVRERELHPTDATYVSLLNAFVKCKDSRQGVNHALHLFNSIGTFRPDNRNLKTCAKTEERDNLEAINKTTKTLNNKSPIVMGPSIEHVNALLSVCVRNRNMVVLWQVYENLREGFRRDQKKPGTESLPGSSWNRNLQPDPRTFATVLRGLIGGDVKGRPKPKEYFRRAKIVMKDAMTKKDEYMTQYLIEDGILNLFLTVCRNSDGREITDNVAYGLTVASEMLGPLVMRNEEYEKYYGKAARLPGPKALDLTKGEIEVTIPRLIKLLDEISAPKPDPTTSVMCTTLTLELVLSLSEMVKFPKSVLERIMAQFHSRFGIKLNNHSSLPALLQLRETGIEMLKPVRKPPSPRKGMGMTKVKVKRRKRAALKVKRKEERREAERLKELR